MEGYGAGSQDVCFSDFDGNGFVDIALTRYLYAILPANLTILFNDGAGNFVEEPQVSADNYELGITNYKSTNYPNPFNPSTTIYFSNELYEQNKQIEITIYNMKGQKIRQFSIFYPQSSITWDGTDQNNNPVSSGVYLYKLNVNGKNEAMKKCLLLK